MIDPDPDMRQVRVGADQPGQADERARRDPINPHPGYEELGEPDCGNDRRHADVGLLDQYRENDEEQRDTDKISGEMRSQLLLGEQPGGDDGEGWLDELRGL